MPNPISNNACNRPSISVPDPDPASAAATAAVASAGTIVGAVAGAAMTFVASVHCGKDLRALYDCEQGG